MVEAQHAPARSRVFVALTHSLDVEQWRRRNASGEVPDATPYGLHHVQEHGLEVTFSSASDAPATTPSAQVTSRLSDAVHHRTGGLEFPHVLKQRSRLRDEGIDAVFSYDERTGFPVATALGSMPSVTGLAWLDRRSQTPRLHRMIAERALARADLMFTQCAPMVEITADEWGISQHRIRFVTLGIDTDFFAEQPWPEPDATPTIVSAGEDRFRDHALLIHAVTQVRDRHRSLHLELATGLPVNPPAGLATLYRERLNGRMRELYARSTAVAVALHPTPTGSGLTVVLEAMASGRPVIVTANPGIADYVEHEETGLLVPPGDVDAFAAAVDALIADPARAREMGRRAAEVARARFASTQMAGRFAELITEIC